MDRSLSPEQMRMLDEMRAGLRFDGPRPGSNMWPYVLYECGPIEVYGEGIDDLIRRGLLIGEPLPASEHRTLRAGPEDFADCDVDVTHTYRASTPGESHDG